MDVFLQVLYLDCSSCLFCEGGAWMQLLIAKIAEESLQLGCFHGLFIAPDSLEKCSGM